MAAREQAVLEVSVTGVDKAASQFSNFQQTTTRTMSASEAAVSRSLKNMVAQFVGVAAAARAVQNVVSSGIGFNQFVENTTTSFTVMMKSADKAKQQMKDLYDFAVSSPLTFKETAASSKQLMAYGFAAEELIPTMKTLGTVAIATGHSLDDISYVYGTLKSQGRAYSRDLMQFGMRGIPIYEELAKVMGVNVNQIQKMASEGRIGFAEVEKAFQNMTTGSGRFSGIIEGYMTTLTGKLSMLGDIAQQSAGTLMSGITDQLKLVVDSLTKTFQNKGFQQYIKSLGDDLGGIASVLRVVLTVVVQLLPILTTFLKIWIAFKALQIASSVLSNIPKLLFLMGDAATAAAASMTAFGTGQAAMSALRMGIATVTASLGALKVAAASFIAANPWILVLASIATAGGAVIILKHVLETNAEKNKTSKDPAIRQAQLAEDYYIAPLSLKEIAKSGKVAADQVAKIAEEYQLADGVVADILIKSNALNAQEYTRYLNLKDSMAYAKAISERSLTPSLTQGDVQQEYLASLTGEDSSRYFYDAMSAMGTRGANDYIKSFADKMSVDKKKYGAAFTPEIEKSNYEAELKALYGALDTGMEVSGLFDMTGFDETIIARIVELNKLLAGTGKTAKEAPKELGTWWAPLIQAAKLTASGIDDIDVATRQSIESAKTEYATRQATYLQQIKASDDREQIISIMKKMNMESALMLQYEKDITAEAEKQKALLQYTYATEGNAAYFENLKAQSGAAYASGNYKTAISTQGQAALGSTQVGSLVSGANPIAMMVTSATEFAKSIKNVNAVLNPFTTLFESMRSLLEPMLNNVLQPLVNLITQVGTALAPIVTLLLVNLNRSIVLLYLQFMPLIAAIQVVSAAYEWVYNTVIVPIGNAMIDIINSMIFTINKVLGWLGVKISYITKLQTTVNMLNDALNVDRLKATMEYAVKKMNDFIDKDISSLADLYDVGAISEADYKTQVADLNAQRISLEEDLVDTAVKQLNTIDDLSAWIKQNMPAYLLATKGTAQEPAVSTPPVGTFDLGAEIVKAMKTFFQSFGDGVIALFTDPLNAMKAFFTDIPKKFGELISSIGNISGIKSAVDGIVSTVSALPGISSAIKGVKGVVDGISNWARDLIRNIADAIDDLLPFADGTANIPHNMPAIVHKGEGIIPATFMDSIRSGELSLSGGDRKGGNGTGSVTIVNVTVQGSVQTENDLANSIATSIYRQRRMGGLTV